MRLQESMDVVLGNLFGGRVSRAIHLRKLLQRFEDVDPMVNSTLEQWLKAIVRRGPRHQLGWIEPRHVAFEPLAVEVQCAKRRAEAHARRAKTVLLDAPTPVPDVVRPA